MMLEKISTRRLSEQRAVTLVLEPLIHAVSWLHQENILHRDIKVRLWCFSDNAPLVRVGRV